MRNTRWRDILAWLVLGALTAGFAAHLAAGGETRLLDHTLTYLAR